MAIAAMSEILQKLQEIKAWADENGVGFAALDDIGRVNAARLAAGLPQFILPAEIWHDQLPPRRKFRPDQRACPVAIERIRSANKRSGPFGLSAPALEAVPVRPASSIAPKPAPGAAVQEIIMPPHKTPTASNDTAADDAEHIPASAARKPGDTAATARSRTDKTVNGLIDALFGTLDDLRDDKIDVEKATAVCRVSAHIMMAMNTRRRIQELAETVQGGERENMLKLVG